MKTDWQKQELSLVDKSKYGHWRQIDRSKNCQPDWQSVALKTKAPKSLECIILFPFGCYLANFNMLIYHIFDFLCAYTCIHLHLLSTFFFFFFNNHSDVSDHKNTTYIVRVSCSSFASTCNCFQTSCTHTRLLDKLIQWLTIGVINNFTASHVRVFYCYKKNRD